MSLSLRVRNTVRWLTFFLCYMLCFMLDLLSSCPNSVLSQVYLVVWDKTSLSPSFSPAMRLSCPIRASMYLFIYLFDCCFTCTTASRIMVGRNVTPGLRESQHEQDFNLQLPHNSGANRPSNGRPCIHVYRLVIQGYIYSHSPTFM